MIHAIRPRKFNRQYGVVLVSSLLLLVVMTILALAMFRTNGVQELIAGNVREKQRALQTAEDAEQFAEVLLSTGDNVLASVVDCSNLGVVPYTANYAPSLCTTPIASIADNPNVAVVPWTVNHKEVGFDFYPGPVGGSGDLSLAPNGGAGTYVQVPRFYIALLHQFGPNKFMFRIDAWNWGGTQNTAAVVESNYSVTINTASLTTP